ncbi:zinc-ribbon domain-containing protein [Paenibacillus xylanexedens]|uniref:zinc-ribbon domain-containing protein n=1 Tax=Paenibacillus xylanexedens TaxID=528191 RepID=UPI00164327AA|nr:zinc-ribbon domain-containing protein [Paenibacillus xylanexedens]
MTSKSGDDFFLNMNVGDKFTYSIFWGYVVDKANKGGAKIDKCGFEMGVVTEKYAIVKNPPILLEQEITVPEHLRKQKKKYLKNENPEIFKQLHPRKNKGIDIDKLTAGSNKRVWWLCPNDHEWETAVTSRTQVGKGNCPHCWRDREINRNNFTKTHPLLTKYWDYEKNGDLKPENYSCNDRGYLNFSCDKGHDFKRYVSYGLPDECPKCRINVRYDARKLSDSDVRKIRKLYENGSNAYSISKSLNINHATVYGIVNRKIYRDIE